jgi:hypothetical protein
MQENPMISKRISLAAALAAAFITGSVAVAYAGRAGDGPPTGDNTSEQALQDNLTPFSGRGWGAPSTGPYAYGYVPERRIVRSHRHGRNN